MKTAIDVIREDLSKAAAREPGFTQPFIRILDTQLRKFANGNIEDQAALRPMIEQSIAKIEASRAGR